VDAAAALMGRLKYERSLRFVWVTGYELALQVTLVLSAMLGIVCHTRTTVFGLTTRSLQIFGLNDWFDNRCALCLSAAVVWCLGGRMCCPGGQRIGSDMVGDAFCYAETHPTWA
jgi:hypothetical protein